MKWFGVGEKVVFYWGYDICVGGYVIGVIMGIVLFLSS